MIMESDDTSETAKTETAAVIDELAGLTAERLGTVNHVQVEADISGGYLSCTLGIERGDAYYYIRTSTGQVSRMCKRGWYHMDAPCGVLDRIDDAVKSVWEGPRR